MKLDMRLHSSLDKVFPDQLDVQDSAQDVELFQNETASFQVSWRTVDGAPRGYIEWEMISPIAQYIRVRRVRSVPVGLAVFEDSDSDYLRRTPGLYPDLLTEVGLKRLYSYPSQRCCIWLDVEPAGLAAGEYPVTIRMGEPEGEKFERTITVRVLPGMLPNQRLTYTRWFYCDCICEAYGVEMLSEEFWARAEQFLAIAAKRGMNAVLTPIHTPPLDTAVGTERMTTQLVGIKKRGGAYEFDFANLDRWVDMAHRVGVEYFEMAHLFTQWGAKAAPKFVADVDGVETRIFGWDTPATSPEYTQFLAQYLTALCAHLKELGIAEKCFFHISDEPRAEMLDDYRRTRAAVEPYLDGFVIMDALSDYEFYRQGVVAAPIVATNHIMPFVEGRVSGLWCYYCVGQHDKMSNSFIAMPSARTRILGVQMYLYHIAGFLQWGYNFYHSQYSYDVIDPYLITDGDGFAPGGDAFIVYPGKDGPEESVRMMVTAEAFQDMRTLEWLEQLRGREFVEELLGEGITFEEYPRGAEWLLDMRRRVNRAICEAQACRIAQQ